ncbi:MAG: YigZ family protein [Phycisphaeraceae bacterium]|nr:YigZ family protein [Phycisphaeraceae bacterium]
MTHSQRTILTDTASAEVTIKNSRFISCVQTIEARDQIRPIVQGLRQVHPKANHVVYAFALGGFGTQIHGQSDDGEPKGTAGYPTLTVLRYTSLTNTLLTTVRYFGGIKLGTGGLVKAYTASAKAVLDKAQTEPLIEKKTLILTFPYEMHRTLQKQLDLPGIVTLDTQYTDQVTLTCTLPADQVPDVTQQLEDATSGHIGITVS